MYTRMCKIWGEFSLKEFLRKVRKMTNEEELVFQKLSRINPEIVYVEKKEVIGDPFYKAVSYRNSKDYGDEEIFSADLKRSTGEARRVKSFDGLTLIKKKFDDHQVVILRNDFEKKTYPATKIHLWDGLLFLQGGEFEGYVYCAETLELKYMAIAPDEFARIHMD